MKEHKINKKSQASGNVLLLVSLLIILIASIALALPQSFTLRADRETYTPNQDVRLFVSGPPSTTFQMRILKADVFILTKSSVTSPEGDWFTVFSSSETGLYEAKLISSQGTASTEFEVANLLDSGDDEVPWDQWGETDDEIPWDQLDEVGEQVSPPPISKGDESTIPWKGQSQELTSIKSISLNLNLKPKKEFYKIDEEPEFELEIQNASSGAIITASIAPIETKLENIDGEYLNLSISVEKIGEKYEIKIPKFRAIRAGMYKLVVNVSGQEEEQWFQWGLVSLNTRKSTYKPGELAEILVIVLDKDGYSICNANLTLNITAPNGNVTTYTTENFSSLECGVYTITHKVELEGNYSLRVLAMEEGINATFETYFLVKDYYDFDIIRTAQSKIDPSVYYNFTVLLNITSYTNTTTIFIKETVPSSFYVTTDAEILEIGDTKILTWGRELIDGKALVNYTYSVPKIWPYLYVLGPLEINYDGKTFNEARPWYVAADPIISSSLTASNGVLTGTYEDERNDYTDTFADEVSTSNANYWHFGDNSGGTVEGWAEFTFDLTSLGISEDDVTDLTFNLTYCHNGENQPSQSDCDGDRNPEGGARSSQLVQIYNDTAGGWMTLGTLSDTYSDSEATGSWSTTGTLADYIAASDDVQIRVALNWSTSAAQDIFIALDYAVLKVTSAIAPSYTTWDLNVSNGTNVSRGDLVLAYAQWNAQPNSAELEHNGTGTRINYSISSPFTNSWTNYTIDTSNTTQFPDAGRVEVRIWAEDLGVYNVTTYRYFYLWGWAEVSSINLDPDTINLNNDTNITCRVIDNATNNAIQGYNVTFYSNVTGYIGWNTTNSTGWAFYTYAGTALGTELITCNITDEPNLYYNDSTTNNKTAVLTIVGAGADADPPTISNINATPQTVGYHFNTTLQATVTDPSGVSSVYINITFPNGTSWWLQMSNDTPSIFYYEFNETWDWGNYSYYIWANDTLGNDGTSSTYYFYVRANATVSLNVAQNTYLSDENVTLVNSNVTNIGFTNFSFYLVMIVQENSTGQWLDYNVTVNETITRNLSSGLSLNLSEVWNSDPWDTRLSPVGWYRILVELRSPDAILRNDNQTYMNKTDPFRILTSAPYVENLSFTPQTIGFGYNVTIDVDANDPNGNLDEVFLTVRRPDGTIIVNNQSMTYKGGTSYQYNVTGAGGDDLTWYAGDYNVTVYANDSNQQEGSTEGQFFVKANITVDVATVKDSYGANEYVNLSKYPSWLSGWDYRMLINVTEPGVNQRYNWPVDVFVETGGKAGNCTKEFRVIDDNGVEIQSRVYNETYVSGNCSSANVVFLVNVSQSQTRTYYLYYSNPSATVPSYTIWIDSCGLDDNATNCSSIFYSKYELPQGLDTWSFDNPMSFGDDSFSERSLPWNFNYFENTFDAANVTSNGYIGLGSAYGSDSSPSQAEFISRSMVAPDWDDLDPSEFGDVYENSYSNRVVWTWDTETYRPGGQPGYRVTFQAVFYQTGDIMLRYGAIEGFREAAHLSGISKGDSGNYSNNYHGNYSNTVFYQFSGGAQISKGEPEKYLKISKTENNGTTDAKFYLLMRVQRYSGGSWVNIGIPVVDKSAGIYNLSTGGRLFLDTIWDNYGGWNTDSQTIGTYRVYAALRGENNNVLTTYQGTPIIATYNFTIIPANVTLTELEHENEYENNINEYETGDNIAWVNITVNVTDSEALNANISLNILKSGDKVSWGPDETQQCGNIPINGSCEKRFDNSSNGYSIPGTATGGVYTFAWNITIKWTNGETTYQNTSNTFIIHHMPDNLSSILSPDEINVGSWSTYNFSVSNPWSENITGVNVTINCLNIIGFNCTCVATGLPYCDVSNISAGYNYTFTFNISTNDSTPVGDYDVNATINYTNPGSETRIWSEQQNKILEVREIGLEAVFYSYPLKVTRNGLINLSSYVNNTAPFIQTNIWFNWTLPSAWTNQSGNLSKFISSLDPYNISWNNITANVSINSQLGPQELRLDAVSDQSTEWDTITIEVWATTDISNFTSNSSDPVRGQIIKLQARLLYDNGTEIIDQVINFTDETDSVYMGSNTTNSTGWAVFYYMIPNTATVQNHTINVSYPGNSTVYTNYTNSTWRNITIFIHDIPAIRNITVTPQTVGYGFNVTIQVNVTDLENVDEVYVNVTLPNGTSRWLQTSNNTADIFYYYFNETWGWGNYSYYIWANDTAGKINQTPVYYFYVRADTPLQVATLQDSYGADEDVNLTDSDQWWWNISWQYRKEINVTEPNIYNRVNWPVDVYVTTGSNADNCTKEFRVIDENGTLIPYTVHNETYSVGKCVSANVVFLANISQNQTKSYWVYYGNPSATNLSFSYWEDSCDSNLNSSNCSTIYYSKYELPTGLDSWDTTSEVASGDDARALASLQWSFKYFNKSYSSVYVVTNGFLDFDGSAGTDFTNTETEFKSYVITAPFWDDLRCYPGSEGVFQNDYANRTVFTWDCSINGDNDNDLTVQAVLYKTGDIMLRYGSITTPGDFSPTVGISSGDSTNYLHNPWSSNEKTAFYQYARTRNYTISGQQSRRPSQITNWGTTNNSGYLLIIVQRNVSGTWTNLLTIVNETTPRTVNLSQTIALDPIWDAGGGWNTNDYPQGTYRVYAVLRDPYGNILTNDDSSQMLATYEFTISAQPPTIENMTATPQTIGYGENVTITVDVVDNVAVDEVYINITFPNGTSIWEQMTPTVNPEYIYEFNQTWQWGTYIYYIWANDTSGNAGDTSATPSYFYVKANASILVVAENSTYTSNQMVYLNFSWANNTGFTNFSVYLLMKVQKLNGIWIDINTTVNESTPRNISSGNFLNLTKIWYDAGGWNTSTTEGGQFRIYVALRAPNGSVLRNDDGSPMNATYHFILSPPVVVEIKEIRIYNVTLASDRKTDTSRLAGNGTNTTFELYNNEVYRVEIEVNNTASSGGSWAISPLSLIYHDNLNPLWQVNETEIWYYNGSQNFTNGTWSSGMVTWNTTLGGVVQINKTVIFYYIVNLSNQPDEVRPVTFHVEDITFSEEDHSMFIIKEDIIPVLFNNIYNLNDTRVNKGESLLAYARWNETIDFAYVEYNSTSGQLQNYTVTLPDPNPRNWTNYTIETNSSWKLGTHYVKFYVNDSYDNWNKTLSYLTFEVWGWAEVNESQLIPSQVDLGDYTTMKCQVRDAGNQTPIQGYAVYFYNSTALLGANGTNSTGWAVFTFSDNTIGNENITCNITDNATLYYNKTVDNELNETLFTKDANPPFYTYQYPPNGTVVHKNDSTVLSTYWEDDLGLDTAILATNETGTWLNKSTYGSPGPFGGSLEGYANFTWSNLSFVGPMGWRVYANDTSDNWNVTTIRWIEVWGWAEINDSYLNQSTIYQYNITQMYCRVRDANNLSPLSGYTVFFYNSTGLMGTNTTNSTGWAVFNYQDSTIGVETLNCTIYDNSTLYYNVTSAYYGEETLTTQPPGGDIWAPNLFNSIYGLINATLYKGTSFKAYARWNEYINASYLEFNSTTPSLETESIALPKNNDRNWTNITIVTNASWFVGRHVVKIYARDNGSNWNNTLSYLELRVWGWSRVDWWSPTGDVNRGILTLKCNVTDNLSLEGIFDYNVNFYNSTDLLGQNDTNGSGVASYTINITDYTLGPEQFTCTIFDETTLFYNKSTQDQDSETLTIYGTLNTTILAPSANQIVYKGKTIDLNSTTVDEFGDKVTPTTTNWYNSTNDSIASGENTTWGIPVGYPLGPEQIKINTTKQYYATGTDIVTITIYGWSNITWVSPYLENYTAGDIIPLVCRVKDANTSQDLQNYNVTFYTNVTDGSLIGSNLTNSTGDAIFYWNTSGMSPRTYNPVCNITNQSNIYYNTSTNDQDNTTITIIPTGYLEVILWDPPNNVTVARNRTFIINATVICRNTASCGDVSGSARYNLTSQDPDAVIPVDAGTPFHTVGDLNPQDCPAPLSQDESCNLSWTINATGDLDTVWEVGVKFTSQSAGSNQTNSSTVNIRLVIIMTLSDLSIDFGNQDPGTTEVAAPNNPITIIVDNNSNDADAIYIRGTNMTNGTYPTYNIRVGNVTWGLVNVYGNGQDLTYNWTEVVSPAPAGTEQDTYYWLDVPYAIYARRYSGTVYIMANVSE